MKAELAVNAYCSTPKQRSTNSSAVQHVHRKTKDRRRPVASEISDLVLFFVVLPIRVKE